MTQEDLDYIQRFCLMDDDFMKVVFQDRQCVSLVIGIILHQSISLRYHKNSYELKNLYGHSVTLDILAVDQQERYYSLEIQKRHEDSFVKRARYYQSMLDTLLLQPSESYQSLKQVCAIWIYDNDIFQDHCPLYHISRKVEENQMSFDDGAQIILVNSKIQDDTPLGLLMKDMHCLCADDMHYSILAQRVRYFKEGKGVKQMCEIMEEIRNKGKQEGELIGEIKGQLTLLTALFEQKCGHLSWTLKQKLKNCDANQIEDLKNHFPDIHNEQDIMKILSLSQAHV